MTSDKNRILLIDECRGIAVLLMAIFHFCYDLSVFGFLTFEMNGGFFTWFRFVIVTLFFTTVGAGLYIAHHKKIMWRAFWRRELKIAIGAVVITVTTVFLYPQSWVWFGVLHFILVASIIALPFVFLPTVALILGLSIFILFNITTWFNLHFLWLQFNEVLNLPIGTQDLTRLIPWLGMIFIGIFLGKVNFWNVGSVTSGYIRKPILWLSKHSLLFYLIHQAPLFGIASLLHKITNI